jgi:hypothetical protein
MALALFEVDQAECFVRLQEHQLRLECLDIDSLSLVGVLVDDVSPDNLAERQKDVGLLSRDRAGQGVDDFVILEVKDVQVVFAFKSKHNLLACQVSHRFDDLFLEKLCLNHDVLVPLVDSDQGKSLVSADDIDSFGSSLSDRVDVTLVLLVFDLALAHDRKLRKIDDREVASLLPAKQILRPDHSHERHVKLLFHSHRLREHRLF